MIKRPVIALFIAVFLGCLLKDSPGKACVIFIIYSLLVFFLIFYSIRFPHALDPYIHPSWFPSLLFVLVLIPVLFFLSFFRSRIFSENVQKARNPYLALYEKHEQECLLRGEVYDHSIADGTIKLKLKKCEIRGYSDEEYVSCGKCLVYLRGEADSLQIGNKIQVYGTLNVFMENENPGGFNSYEYYLPSKLFASVYARSLKVTDRAKIAFPDFLTKSRNTFGKGLTTVFGNEKGGILYAMLAGDKSLLSSEVKERYKMMGISHILAISGAHITLLCMGVNIFLLKLGLHKRSCGLISCMVALLYLLFIGMSLSALRAVIMFLCLIFSQTVRKRNDLLSSLFLAGSVILLILPTEYRSASFILSFLAVIGVHFATQTKEKIFAGFIINLFTLPATMWFYSEFSTYGFLFSMIALPLLGALLTSGGLAGLIGIWAALPARFVGGIAAAILSFFDHMDKITDFLPFACVLTGKPSVLFFVVYYLALFLLMQVWEDPKAFRESVEKKLYILKKIQKRRRTVIFKGFAVCIVLVFAFLLDRKPLSASITFLSVGQGDSAVFSGPSHGDILFPSKRETVVFDLGSSDKDGTYEYILLPFLKEQRVMLIDHIVVSHTDSDHISGIMELLLEMPELTDDFTFARKYSGRIGVKNLILPETEVVNEALAELIELANEKKVSVTYAKEGYILPIDDKSNATVKCIFPGFAYDSSNETSLVFWVETDDFAAFMMGDCEASGEKEILSRYGADIENTKRNGKKVVLKVGHHGSKTSSCDEWIECLRPDIAVISCGYNNKYGHPSKQTVTKFKNAGCIIHRTDEMGAFCTIGISK